MQRALRKRSPCGSKTSIDSLGSLELNLVHDLKQYVRDSDMILKVAVAVIGVHSFRGGLRQRQQQRDRVAKTRSVTCDWCNVD